MRILALDLGTASTRTHAHLLDTETGEIIRQAISTSASAFIDLLQSLRPDQVVTEPTPITGVIVDICAAKEIAIKVANIRDPAWQNRTSKTDRNDAELMARLAATGQLRTVLIPHRDIRQWRVLISYRHRLIRTRTSIKNRIKALLRNELHPTKGLWSAKGLIYARSLAKIPTECTKDELWSGVLFTELSRYDEIQVHIKSVTAQLDAMVENSDAATALAELSGVGNRLAEALVATLVSASRFKNRREVAAYIGLCPRVLQSGKHSVYGRITKAGNGQLRTLLMEVSQIGSRRDPWMKAIFDHVERGDKSRSNRAVTAVARRLLVRCWAILRDLEHRPPPSEKAPSQSASSRTARRTSAA